MTQISRRRLTTGAAWTVPVIVIGAAAPTAAASGCSEVTVVSAVANRGGVVLELQLSPFVAGYCLTSFSTSGIKELTWPGQPCFETNEPVTLRGLGTNSGNDFRGTYSATYVLVGPGGNVCPAQVLSFTAV
jgi:hypothetical protein